MTDAPSGASANPFASRFINALPFRSEDVSVHALRARLVELGGRAAIVGPHGSGKTTLMERLGDELASTGWRVHAYRTRERCRRIDSLASRPFDREDAVLLDGAGHIGPLVWRHVLRRIRNAGRVVITAHRSGRLPTLYQCEASLTLLDALVRDLAADRAAELRPVSHRLYANHGGNVRDVLRGLYDHCAGLS